jgi:predicted ATPase
MAPEVLRGEQADHRADQFALGIVLYELATGQRPFKRSTRAEILVATLEESPEPLSTLRQDLPAGLRRIIERCLAKAPGQRYADTGEILEALKAVPPGPARESVRRRGLLPTPATPLLGREKELQQVRQLLTAGRVRLLTLTGMGGSGKTRLAIEVAHDVQSEFPGGVVFVSLGTIQEKELVAPTIAAAFGGTEATEGQDLPELLANLTEAEGRMLLVLDNFEQVIGAASVVGDLLQRCPNLTILATSREVLHLRAEQGFPVTPLPVPPANAHASLDAIREAPAVALFIERARAAKPDFELTERNAQAVLEFCRRLDGLPLALELAAARVRTLPLRAMLQRLEGRMELLTGGPRDLPARQQTLRATLQWSFELLDEAEQAAFRRLAAFIGGFTLEAAEAVVDPFGSLDRSVVDVVESLHDQSLLQRMPEADDEPRFTMLEIIRDYATELLHGSSDEKATRKAHAAYYLILAEEGEVALNTGQSEEWLERFELEEANFRAALQWLIDEDEAEWGLRMALGLFRFWELGEGRAEGQRRFAQLLALPAAQPDSVLRAKGLFAAGVLSEYQEGRESDTRRIVGYHEEALAISRRLNNPLGQAVALNALGIVYADRGHYDKAHECYEECMELWRELGESDAYARSLSNFASVLRSEGELERARQLYRESADIFKRLGDSAGAAWEVNHEAAVARDQEDPQAGELYAAALASFQELGEPWGIATTLLDLGSLKHREGKLEEANALYREALGLFCRVGHQRGVARVLEALAALAGAQQEDAQVMRLAGAAEGLRKRLGNPPIDPWIKAALDGAVTNARECLDAEARDRAWERGLEEPVDQLVDELCGS